MLNKCILIGRLGKDPETRYTDGGKAVSNFSLATEESYKDRAGERQKRTEWHRIVLWGKLAEIAQQYLKKGALVYVEGRIESGEYEKNGEKVRTFQIVASLLRMLGDRGESRNNGTAAAASEPAAQSHAVEPPKQNRSRSGNRSQEPSRSASAEAVPASGYQVSDEDIPF